MGKSSAPKPPDPKETSAATTGTNVATAIANAVLQNPNQTTPFGSVNYSFGGTQGPKIEQYQIAGTPGTGGGNPVGYGEPGTSGSFSDRLNGGTAGTPGKTGYRVGGKEFGTYEEAQAYQRGLPGYEADANYTWTDPYTGESYTIPRISVDQTLTPEGQQVQDNNVQTQINLSDLSKNQSGFLGEYMQDPLKYNPGEHEQWATGLYDKINGDKLGQDQQSMASRLAQQGIGVGTEAYSRSMEDLYGGQQSARDRFMLDSYGQGMQTALTNRNQPINEIIGLMGGSQVQQPNFINPNISGINGTDNGSIIANAANQEMQAWQQNQASSGSMLSGLGGLFQGLGSTGMLSGLTLSDERAKTDKKKIGKTKDGLGLYSYKYKGSDKTEVGLMAQEVKKRRPEAVHTTPSGLMAVDYGAALK